MEQRNRFKVPAHQGVIDSATLYLCRQGPRWVVVIESPRVSGAIGFRHTGNDTHDARSELLSSARHACPDAAIISTDGALEGADFEWRLEVRGLQPRPGDLGVALERALTAKPGRASGAAPQTVGRRCHWGHSPVVSGRPRAF